MRKCSRCKTMLADDYFYQSCEKCRDKQKIQVRQNQLNRMGKGLCQRCGKVPNVEGRTMCRECMDKQVEKNRNNRIFYESVGMCKRCGKNEPLGNHKWCAECIEKSRQTNRNRRDWDINWHKRVYYERKEAGLCCGCGKPTEGKVYCEKCGARRNLESRMRKERKKEGIGLIPRSERISFGLCYTCGNPLDVEGKKMCSKCMSTNYICNGNLTGGVNQHWIRDNQRVFKKCNQKKDA